MQRMCNLGERAKDTVPYNPQLVSHFDISVCDEAHNMPVFLRFSPQPNFASIAHDHLCNIAEHTDTLVADIAAMWNR